MENQNLKIEYIEISKLIDYENNSRAHDDLQLEDIENSIKEYGFINPILIDENNVIIAGHGRKLAAIGIGMEMIPCIVLKDLTEDQRDAYRIADNRIPQNASWDLQTLINEVDRLYNNGFNIDRLGFSESELNKILAQVKKEDEPEEDRPIPEISANDDPMTDEVIKEDEEIGELKEVIIKIKIPEIHAESVKEFLSNGESQTIGGMGRGVLKRCGIL